MLGSRARLGTYLLGWVPITALTVAVALSQGWPLASALAISIPTCLGGAFLFLSSWYLCRALPLRSVRVESHWAAWILAAAIMGSLWAYGALLLAWSFNHIPGLRGVYGRTHAALPTLLGMGVLLYLAVLAVHYLLDAVERGKASEAREAEFRILAQDAELRALRAQLNPHFLFNSLNSISALTTLDPGKARRMCILLSEFLRGSLRLGEKKLVTIAEEVDLLKAYLSIEQIRFGERLQVDWQIAPEAAPETVPALLLQPLVENAIKHGIAGLPEGGTVRITARKAGKVMEVSVENPVDPDTPPVHGLGLGLKQVRSRLQMRFGERMRFDAGISENVHRVKMLFPAEEAP
jgi:two-component system, LytTR family, sensor histidine kinase AlgZ